MIAPQGWHWFALGAILVTLEVLLGANFFFLWPGIIAFLLGILLFFIPISIEWQLLFFAIGVGALLLVWPKLRHKFTPKGNALFLNQRARQYIGREFTLEEPIVNGVGKVRVDDSTWKVEGNDMPAQTKIKVVDVDGVILKVKKLQQ